MTHVFLRRSGTLHATFRERFLGGDAEDHGCRTGLR